MIWKKEPDLDLINKWCEKTAVDNNGIVIVEATEDSLIGTMPIDERTVQPQRRLHGGVSCVLSESLASIGANMTLDQTKYTAFGISIEANHLRPVMEGKSVKGIATPIHIGKTIQVWTTSIYDDQEKLICNSKLTLAVVKTR